MKKISISCLVDKFKLKSHWDEDFLVEFYRSDVNLPRQLIGEAFDGDRPLFNWAYYLLPEGVICPFHLHLADESWQFCLGGPLDLFLIHKDGRLENIRVGSDILNGEELIYIAPKDVWMAAKTVPGAEYSLITHMVAPAFYPQDNTKGYYEVLCKQFPQHEALIRELAWPKK